MGNLRKKLLLLSAVIFLVLIHPVISLATETGSMSVYPAVFDPNVPNTRAWYQLRLNPLDDYSSEITIANKSDIKKTINLYAVDATTTADGVFALLEKGKANDLGGWITLANSVVSLEPKQTINVPFKITVPVNAQPGDHTAGIVAEDGISQKQQGISIISRIGVRVYLNVSGTEKEKLNIENLSFENLLYANNINVSLSNDGNVNEDIKIEYAVLGLNGFKKFQVDDGRVVFAGKKIIAPAKINMLLPFVARAEVSFGKKAVLTQATTIVSPVIYIILFLILALGFYFYWRKRIKALHAN